MSPLSLEFLKNWKRGFDRRRRENRPLVSFVDSAGSTVANYTYDAWGKLLSVKNASGATITSSTHIAIINPIRYRGYYYDAETGWYYLQSRYYDPEIGRFINADDVTMLGANEDFASYNLFAYCGNKPISREDTEGKLYGEIIGAVLSVASTWVAAKATGQSYTLKDFAVAAVVGALNASPIGWLNIAAAVVSGVATGISCYDQGATIGASIVCGAASTALTACFAGSLGKLVNGGKALSDGVSAGITATFGTGAAFIGAGANKIAVDNYQRSNNNAQGQRSSNISRNRRYGGYSRYGEYSRYGGYSGYRRTNTRNSYLRR